MGKAPYNDPEKPKPILQTMTTYLPTELISIAHSAARTELLGVEDLLKTCSFLWSRKHHAARMMNELNAFLRALATRLRDRSHQTAKVSTTDSMI
jgi:hypothetical protein